ncbi:MAG: hypothetical protein OEN23_18495 [Paracoccaceae bacterium]|nr:hypothetical protein [Paracoccaceae bacterium]
MRVPIDITDLLTQFSASTQAIAESDYSVKALTRLALAAVLLKMKPKDAILFDVDRRPWAESSEFLSKRTLVRMQDILNPREHHKIVVNKLDYHATCASRGIAAPQVIAVVDFEMNDGRVAAIGARRITTETELADFLASLPPETRLALKPIIGTYARGLLCLTTNEGRISDHTGRRWRASEVLDHCRQDKCGFLVQPWLEPDPALHDLMPHHAFGMARIISVLVDLEPSFPFAFLKIPVGDNIADSFAGGKTQNLIAALDVVTGTLGQAYGPSQTSINRIATCKFHPTTGHFITGFQIPRWGEVIDAVRRGARAFSEFGTLGWDVAISKDGIYLVEANHRWDPAVQITVGRGIRLDMLEFVRRAQST